MAEPATRPRLHTGGLAGLVPGSPAGGGRQGEDSVHSGHSGHSGHGGHGGHGGDSGLGDAGERDSGLRDSGLGDSGHGRGGRRRRRRRSGGSSRVPGPGPFTRLGATLLALAAGAAGAWLASQHALNPPVALLLFGVAAVLSLAWPLAWLVALPAAWPLLGLAPWSGALMVEETDIALLAVVAGVGLRWALQPRSRRASAWAPGRGPLALAALVLLVWCVSVAVSAWRGAVDAGGLVASAQAWWQGYRGPMNALRLAKPTLAMLLWLLLWHQAGALARPSHRGRRRLPASPAMTLATVPAHASAAGSALDAGAAEPPVDRGDPRSRWLTLGLSLGLAVVAGLCLQERLAYTGLLDFSSDYRTTGPFWEMHVGGAALDAFLAMALPFAVRQAWRTRTPLGWVAAAVLLLLAAYAALTSFSRIVYLALPAGLVLMLWLQRRQQPLAVGGAGAAWAAALLLCGVMLGSSAWLFAGSGYRGMLGLLGSLALLLALVPPLGRALQRPAREAGRAVPAGRHDSQGARRGQASHADRRGQGGARLWLAALACSVPLAALAAGVALALPKGPYLAHGVLVLAGLALAWWPAPRAAGQRGAGQRSADQPSASARETDRWPARWRWPLAVACHAVAAATLVVVAGHWGGLAAGSDALPVALALVLALPLLATWSARTAARGRPAGPVLAFGPPLWPASRRWQAGVLLAMALTGAVVGVFGGGAYMTGRVDMTAGDQQHRVEHWRGALRGVGDGAPRWLGLGLGRFLDHYALGAAAGQRPGDIRLELVEDGVALRLVAGTHLQTAGGVLRLTQVLDAPPTRPLTLTLQVRHATANQLRAEVCRKHLLYSGECWAVQQALPVGLGGQAAAPQWHTVRVPLSGPVFSADDWFAPRRTVFTLATETAAQPIEVRGLSLADDQGREFLRNGDLGQGGARWFFTSDHNHLPWHAKNMAVHLLVEQGLLGLLAGVALFGAALLNLVWGPGRSHPLAPALAAALLGVLTVGAIDSLLDMPRVATLALLLAALGAGLGPAATRTARAAQPVRH